MEKQLDTELEEKDLPEVITEDEITTIVNPGDEVPGGFTYSNNAVIQNKSLNLKDANGTDIANRYVSNCDKIGNGSKAVFAGFAIHVWEDNWNNDGLELVKLVNALALKIVDYKAQNGGLHGWTYIAPCMNPDAVIVSGTTGAV